MDQDDPAAAYSRLSSPSDDDEDTEDIEKSPQHLFEVGNPEKPIEAKTNHRSSEVKRKWASVAVKAASSEEREHIPLNRYSSHGQAKRELLKKQKSVLAGADKHVVFKPGTKGERKGAGIEFAILVNNIVAENKEKVDDRQRQSLRERLQQFNLHTDATKEVLKEQTEELINKPEEFEIETEDNSFRNITLKLMHLNRSQSDSLDGGGITSPEITAPKLLAASSALKWRHKAKMHHPKIPEEVTEMALETKDNSTGIDAEDTTL